MKRRVPVRTKILLTMSLPVVILTAAAAFDLWGTVQMTNAHTKATAASSLHAKIRDVILQTVYIQNATQNLALTGDSHASIDIIDHMQAAENDTTSLDNNTISHDAKEANNKDVASHLLSIHGAIDDIRGSANNLTNGIDKNPLTVITAYRGGKGDVAKSVKDFTDAKTKLETNADWLLKFFDEKSKEEDANFIRTQTQIFWGTVLSIIIALIVAFVTTLPMASRLAKRIVFAARSSEDASETIRELQSSLNDLASGNLTSRHHYVQKEQKVLEASNDEIGDLLINHKNIFITANSAGEAFNKASSSLQELVKKATNAAKATNATADGIVKKAIKATSEGEILREIMTGVEAAAKSRVIAMSSTANGVAELSTSAQQIASGAVSQSLAVRRSYDATNVLETEITTVATSGEKLVKTMHVVKNEVKQTSEAVNRAIHVVQDISTAYQRDAGAMRELGDQTASMMTIVETIDNIADQTNLLALNAAIEAARAGDHGRGFAVVADEVRKLAESATKQAKEIATLIREIRGKATKLEESMGKSATQLDGVSGAASEALTAIESLQERNEQTADVSNDLAKRTQSMREAGTQLAENMAEIASIIEESAAASEEAERTAVSVKGQIEPLLEIAQQQVLKAGSAMMDAQRLVQNIAEITEHTEDMRTEFERLQETLSAFTIEDENQTPFLESQVLPILTLTGAGSKA